METAQEHGGDRQDNEQARGLQGGEAAFDKTIQSIKCRRCTMKFQVKTRKHAKKVQCPDCQRPFRHGIPRLTKTRGKVPVEVSIDPLDVYRWM